MSSLLNDPNTTEFTMRSGANALRPHGPAGGRIANFLEEFEIEMLDAAITRAEECVKEIRRNEELEELYREVAKWAPTKERQNETYASAQLASFAAKQNWISYNDAVAEANAFYDLVRYREAEMALGNRLVSFQMES